MRTLSVLTLSALLLPVQSQPQADSRGSDPRVTVELVTATATPKLGQPILIDVYLQNREKMDIRKNQFSPLSSSVGTPTIRIVKMPKADEVRLSPGAFLKDLDEWDRWYQPATGRAAGQVGSFIIPAGARIHLLHGDLRHLVHASGEYCQEKLAEGTLLEKPEAAATKTEYEKIVRFAGLFAAGGNFDVSVWAYSQSNTVRIRVESARSTQ